MKSRLVLRPAALDISGADALTIFGGDALAVDAAVFDKRPNPDQSDGSIYWQKNTEAGHRLAVKETNTGWRGDTYEVAAVPDSMAFDEAAKRTGANGSWRPPFIFQSNVSKRLWLVFVGEPYQVLGAWSVHAIGSRGLESRCTIEFSSNSDDPVTLLPPAVVALERLLDRTIGSGREEGTLQPTAAIRLTVQHTWGNLALRPWALGQPYNTRTQVDAALAEWASGVRRDKRLLDDIRAHYEPAERALAAYYKREFQRSSTDAAKFAAYALDVAYRMHFVFHRDPDGSEKAQSSNPWHSRVANEARSR